MSSRTYKEILNQAKKCKTNVEKQYKNGIGSNWSYYFAKAIVTKKDVKIIKVTEAKNQQGEHISRGISKADYTDMAKRYTAYVEKHNQLPNYLEYKGIKIAPHLLTGFFAKVLANNFPNTQNINRKWYTKPSEAHNEVYDYFVKVFGKFDNTIDGALSKVEGRGYAYYYDDVYSNKQSIDRLKKGQGE